MSVLTAGAPPRQALRYQLDSGVGLLTPAERAARRQLRDWKYSIVIEALIPRGLRVYGEICGWSLARAHARSGDRIAIAAYLGSSDVFDQASARFAAAYADQNERDHQPLVVAVSSGRITAEQGL